jgi:CysZ protein
MMSSPLNTLGYYFEGIRIINQQGLRRFVLVPLLINLIIFVAAVVSLFDSFAPWLNQLLSEIPTWLQWLSWLIWPLMILCVLIIYGYCFNVITNIIAAPFLGLLAEKIESHLTGTEFESESFTALTARTIKREITKLWYFVSRGLLVLLLFLALLLIPGVNILGMLLAGLWSSWCLAIQYVDYAADNNRIGFYTLRERLAQRRTHSLCVGGVALLGSMVPLVNVVITPVAVAGATVYWVREIRKLEPQA